MTPARMLEAYRMLMMRAGAVAGITPRTGRVAEAASRFGGAQVSSSLYLHMSLQQPVMTAGLRCDTPYEERTSAMCDVGWPLQSSALLQSRRNLSSSSQGFMQMWAASAESERAGAAVAEGERQCCVTAPVSAAAPGDNYHHHRLHR